MTSEKKPDWEHYYNWPKTINKMEGAGATGCMVVGANDLGKTFGIRYMAIRNFITRSPGKGRQFVEICRNQNEVGRICADYTTKIQQVGFFHEWSFAAKGGVISARHDYGEEDCDIPWEPMGYVVALSARMKSKRVTYPDVGYTIFDEVVIEYDDKYHRYEIDEWSKLERLCVALWRETPDKPSNGRLFLLGNSVDIACPYFEKLGIGIPQYGQRWCMGKSWLFDYPRPSDYRAEKLRETTVYKLFHGADRSSLLNEFAQNNPYFISERSEDAKYRYAVVCHGYTFGVWRDEKGITYITRKMPRDWQEHKIYAITNNDNKPNYDLVKRTSDIFKVLIQAHYNGNIRYDTALAREQFVEVLKLFGLR